MNKSQYANTGHAVAVLISTLILPKQMSHIGTRDGRTDAQTDGQIHEKIRQSDPFIEVHIST